MRSLLRGGHGGRSGAVITAVGTTDTATTTATTAAAAATAGMKEVSRTYRHRRLYQARRVVAADGPRRRRLGIEHVTHTFFAHRHGQHGIAVS